MVTSRVNSQRMKALCKVSLSAFIQKAFQEVGNGEYHHAWHIDAMSEYLTACYKRDIKRLIINVPPRSLKSISVTIGFPAWALGHNPKLEIMAASYSQDLSEDHSVACRKIMRSDWYREIFPDTILAPDQNQKSKFNTTAGGARRATSVGGTSIGKGGNCFVAGTRILTEHGYLPIEELVRGGIKVYSYNHESDTICLNNIEAFHERTSDNIIEIQTSKGRKFRCTSDHRIYLPQFGYTEAKDCKENDELYCTDRDSLHPMRQTFYKGTGGNSQDVEGKQQERCLLLSKMFARSSCSEERQEVQRMLQYGKERRLVLLRRLQNIFKKCEKYSLQTAKVKAMSILSGIVLSMQQYGKMLFFRMFGEYTFATDVARWEFELSGRQRTLYNSIPKNEALNKGKGWKRLYELSSIQTKNDGSSCGSQQKEQFSGKFNNSVYRLPYFSSQKNMDSIKSISRISGEAVPVYDIQVEGTHNFFAEEILVHNCLILDDPLSPLQASSDTERKSALNFLQQSWMTRLNDKKQDVSIIVMQRLHEEDPAGFLLAQGGWEHLFLPAVNDAKRTITIGNFTKEWAAGEYLDDERLGEHTLEQIKVDLGSAAFAGQYMQRPSPEGGGIIKDEWWQLWEGKEPPKTHDIIQVYDTAFTEKTSNDYCARTTWGIFEAENGEMNIILLERMNKRMEFPELLQAAKEGYIKYTKSKTGEPPLVLIEEKASGLPLIQELRKTGVRVKGIKRNANSGDKISRCHNITHIFENGRVWVPCNVHEVDGKKHYSPKPFAQEVISQCSLFPNGAHDDLVDTVVDAVAYLRKWREIRTDYDKEEEPEYGDSSGKKKRYY